MAIKLIVGLANFQDKHNKTRHNMGAMYVNLLSKKYDTILKNNHIFNGSIGKIIINGLFVYLFIPNTYMNLSGVSIVKVVNFYQLALHEVLIAHDELDLLPGDIRIKFGGHHAGHNGLKNIIKNFDFKHNFFRLRIGIGRPNDKNEIINFVLSQPSYNDKIIIYTILNKIINITDLIITGDINQIMNRLHL